MDHEFWRRMFVDTLIERVRSVTRRLVAPRWLALAAITMFAIGLSASEIPSLDPVADLELRDQNGQVDSLAAHRDQAVVVMVVNAKRLRNLKAWEKDLRNRFEDIHFLRIAEVPANPPTTFELVASKLSERIPEGVSVLIDMDSVWSTQLGLDTSRPNILLVTPEGTLASSFRGRHEPGLASAVVAEIEALLEGV